MRWRRRMAAGAGGLLVVLAACAPTDLGTPCHLLRADDSEAQPMPGHDVIQSGSGECEQFVCASFDGAPPVCSRPCANAGDACEDGMTCRAALLDPSELASARQRLSGHDDDHNGVDDYEQWAAGLSESLYCAPDGAGVSGGS